MTSLHSNLSQNHFPKKTGGLNWKSSFLRSPSRLSRHSNLITLYTQTTMIMRILSIFFFQSQTLLEEQNAVLPDLHLDTIKPQLSHIILSPNEVERVLETLPIGNASGPNTISNRILWEFSSELSTPLCPLFNHSLHTGCIPISYKEANVTPVPKKGDLSIVSNYRPTSLLNSEDKVFERLGFKHLYNHLHRHNIISSLQSGFMSGDSTVNQLAYLYNTFCQTLDALNLDGSLTITFLKKLHAKNDFLKIRVVFCVISKAFDRVWHSRLL